MVSTRLTEVCSRDGPAVDYRHWSARIESHLRGAAILQPPHCEVAAIWRPREGGSRCGPTNVCSQRPGRHGCTLQSAGYLPSARDRERRRAVDNNRRCDHGEMMNVGKANAVVIMILIFLAAFPALPLAAQSTTSAILGTINDASGAAVPGVTITATNTATDIAQTSLSDERGRYRVPSLNVGQYDVKAELAGFQTVIHKGIQVTVGRDVVVDFALQVGQLTEAITVTQEVPQVDTTTAQLSNLVDEGQLR